MTLSKDARRFAHREAARAVPKPCRQRQDSLKAQLITVFEMANRAGCHDAADWIKQHINLDP